MFDQRIDSRNAAPASGKAVVSLVRSLLASLDEFAIAAKKFSASHHSNSTDSTALLGQRYAAANSVTRRRFDTLLKEAQLIGAVGIKLVEARPGGNEASTIAAARFLGSSLATALHRLENLIAPQSAA